MRKLLLTGAAIAALTIPAHAGDLAFVLGNSNYDRIGAVKGADGVAGAQSNLQAAGFAVLSAKDADAGDIRTKFRDFVDEAAQADTVAVTLSGRFVHTRAETYFLPVDVRDQSLPEAVSEALPLSAVLSVLAAHPGHAVLVLGADKAAEDPSGLTRPGIGTLDIPQGVSVLRGTPQQVVALLKSDFAQPGQALAAAASSAGLSQSGYLPDDLSLVSSDAMVQKPAKPAPAPAADPSAAYWDLARTQDTVDAYQLYLNRYPDGPHADDARTRITALKAQPAQQASAAEDALGLTRDQRREVQQYLTILDYDPKGVDGVFGPGSRAAIARWQRANGFEDTSYLTRDQLTRLSGQGEKRSAELDAQAKARQAEIDKQDRSYWEQTGKAGDEPGLRAYLKKYPDGLFADLAQERLDKIEAERRADAQSADRADWDAARRADTISAYRDYLSSRDKPAFRAEAEARIAALRDASQDSAADAQAKANEDALGLPGVAKSLVEQRLQQMGLKPGKVDGVFTPETRRAIRRYQKAGGLTPTGYLDQATVAQLLSGAIGFR
ncbi:peptidoglycan-binding protein [Thioclava sp. BHET1]|nr:peptidoglycan-binding protein [Thioclava sp. BHET1]